VYEFKDEEDVLTQMASFAAMQSAFRNHVAARTTWQKLRGLPPPPVTDGLGSGTYFVITAIKPL